MSSTTLTPIQRRIINTAAELATQDDCGPLVYQHALLCQVGLPRSKQPGRTFERAFKNASLKITAGELWLGGEWKPQPLPYGPKPRIALYYINSQAVQTRSTVIDIGGSYTEFCELLGLSGEGSHFYQLKRQMQALAAAHLNLGFTHDGRDGTLDVKPIKRFEAWTTKDKGQMAFWPAVLELHPDYHNDLLHHAVPIPQSAVCAVAHSALCIDQLQWLAHRLPFLEKPLRVPFVALKEQFGQEYKGKNAAKDFRTEFLDALRQVLTVYRDAKVEQVTGGLLLKPSRALVPKTIIQGHSLPEKRPKALPRPYPSRDLSERTIEDFKRLWPGLDVYACKADFDNWLTGAPETPKNYERAFMGFARKWSKGRKANS